MADEKLADISKQLRSSFSKRQSLLSFVEYMELLRERPYYFVRCAPQYMVDAVNSMGFEDREHFGAKLRRPRLFDKARPDGSGKVAGQEEPGQEIYRLLLNFARQGYADRLILLYGPNGSAKTTIVSSFARCLENYSKSSDGALYRFEWIFPKEKVYKGGRLGFSGTGNNSDSEPESFAKLDEGDIASVIPCELKDPPLFLLPRETRQSLFSDLFPSGRLSDEYPIPSYMLNEGLCPKCKQIFDALLTSYRGDFDRVLKHVRVRRYDISKQYRSGAVSVHPQVSVDARLMQVTADQGYASLPPALRSIPFFVPFGELIDANRGIIEYDDLLKRPVEAFKYLLTTAEMQSLALENRRFSLDLVMIATTNDRHLESFKSSPQLDFASFKGRIELVRVPYLLRATDEKRIYQVWAEKASAGKHVSPHAVELAALWAVLTRLRRPDPEHFDSELASAVRDLDPLDKAMLYDRALVPDSLSPEEARALKKAAMQLRNEFDTTPDYEGRFGASPREIKGVLLNASQRTDHRCLSPLAIFQELENLCADETVYEFLQFKAQGLYHDAKNLIRVVRDVYVEIIDDEFKTAVELMDQTKVDAMFERYVKHVTHSIKGEKLLNPVTGKFEQPDEDLMHEVEGRLGVTEDAGAFRSQLISGIGAYGIDNPNEELEYRKLFPDLIERLEENLFKQLAATLQKSCKAVLDLLGERKGMEEEERELANKILDNLKKKFGYCDYCAGEAIGLLMQNKYSLG
ncbi:MAG: serine protein kinase PrkA [Deltaproteobacteria bacterium]|nr:serine protein kinase PrkA [Deltaproteobacteria bacterium]